MSSIAEREVRPPLLPAIPQQSNIARHIEAPETPSSIPRNTEMVAFKRMAAVAGIKERTRNRTVLSGLHIELLRLERGAMQHLPQLTYDERMEFIAEAARLRKVSRRQIAALLDQASDIIMLRELNGETTALDDLNEQQTKNLYRGTVRVSTRKAERANTRQIRAVPAAAR